MTTLYSSKQSAVESGIFYARGVVDIPFETLTFQKETVRHPLDDEGKYDLVGEKCVVENDEGKQVDIVVTPCGQGFHLWLCIDGACLRA